MKHASVVSLDGSSFLIVNTAGDLVKSDPGVVAGFFYRDTRHLSEWSLTVNGAFPQVLSCDDLEYYFTQHFLAPQTGTIYENPYLSLARRRLLGDGFVETLEITNHSNQDMSIDLQYSFGCDFADLFEVKDALKKKGQLYQEARDKDWILGYKRDQFVRETLLHAPPEGTFSQGKYSLRIVLGPKEVRLLEFQVIPIEGGAPAKLKYSSDQRVPRPNLQASFSEWLQTSPRVRSDVDAIRRIYNRSLIDLAALRFYPDPVRHPKLSLPSAGLPWFMALFGRDSIITSYQALPFTPELAAATLRTLAYFQGNKTDLFKDEEPGKILHELRFGELTFFHERPQSPYYGAADSTPLFLILLDEYERWTGDRKLVRDLESNARRALEWIDRHGDRDGDGFVEYQRGMETGLENQCWKDSWNSILFSDGRVSEAPRATCEIQGYVYDAKVRTARLAKEVWNDPKLAERLTREAETLKQKFNQAFWIPEKNHYALALDKDKRQVDSLSSNIGHLLWSGIVPEDKAKLIRDHLMSSRLFSGWGIRTMGEGESGYNPIEYHNGTVWPHDCSLIAMGLARYGFRADASNISVAMLSAATFFNFRLPEVFAGYSRDETEFPVEYPTASSPQAWATGAPLLALRVILGLEVRDKKLEVAPVLPYPIGQLTVEGVRGTWGVQNIEAIHKHEQEREKFFWDWLEKRADLAKRKAA
jgi:glycogen debranching enzyme